jgi:hypothetical protein
MGGPAASGDLRFWRRWSPPLRAGIGTPAALSAGAGACYAIAQAVGGEGGTSPPALFIGGALLFAIYGIPMAILAVWVVGSRLLAARGRGEPVSVARLLLGSRRMWVGGALWAQVMAFFVVLSLDPYGFDTSEGVPSPSARAMQRRVGELGVLVILAAMVAVAVIWRRRRSDRAASVFGLAVLAGVAYVAWAFYGGF